MYVNTKEMLIHARENGYAVVGAEAWSLDSARCLVETAVECNTPLIVMLWEAAPADVANSEAICRLVREMAGKTTVPIAMHFDHGTTMEAVAERIHQGYSSVMLDASRLPFDENVKATEEVVRIAHACGVTVEAELGHVGSGTDAGDPGVFTRPQEAVEFVERTGVDSLAVSIGTAHGVYSGTPHLDLERLKEIAAATDVPLVLHGGSGTGLAALREASRLGISKLNVFTDFHLAAREAVLKSTDDFWERSMREAVKNCLKEYLDAVSRPLGV